MTTVTLTNQELSDIIENQEALVGILEAIYKLADQPASELAITRFCIADAKNVLEKLVNKKEDKT